MDHNTIYRQDRIAFLNTHASLPAVAELALFVAVTITQWSERRKMRAALRQLPDYLLKDIGVSKVKAETEGEKPFWQR